MFNGNVLVTLGFPRQHLQSIDAETGALLWELEVDQISLSSPSIRNNLLFVGTDAGTVFSINLTDQDVNSLFSMEEAILVVEDVLKQQALGMATNLPRGHDIAGPGTYLAYMQAVLYHRSGKLPTGQGVFGFKTYTASSGQFRFQAECKIVNRVIQWLDRLTILPSAG